MNVEAGLSFKIAAVAKATIFAAAACWEASGACRENRGGVGMVERHGRPLVAHGRAEGGPRGPFVISRQVSLERWGGRCPYDNTPIPAIVVCGAMGTGEYAAGQHWRGLSLTPAHG